MFEDSITILEAKQHFLIPEYLWHEIPDICLESQDGCGAELMTTKNLTKQWCPNPRCKQKLIAMSVKTLNRFEYKGVGPGFFTKFFTCNPKYISHLAIFQAPEEEFYATGEISATANFLAIRKQILSQRYLFSELVANLAFPGIDNSALELFNLFENYQAFKMYLEYKNLSIINYIKKFPGYEQKRAMNIARTLNEFEKDILIIPKIFQIKHYAKTEIEIAITGEPNYRYMTKKEYVAHLNRIGMDIVHVKFTQSALQSCDYIVCSSANEYLTDRDGDRLLDSEGQPMIIPGSIKKNIGIARNKSEGRKVLVTPEEMKEIVRKTIREVRENE